MMMPVVPEASTPASTLVQSIVIDLLSVTVPKPPESRQSISPFAAVLEYAPANVLQGAVRLHGLASAPTPETHVRVAWAWAKVAQSSAPAITVTILDTFCMSDSLLKVRR